MKYSEKHQVNFYECDENQHLKLPAMINLMMSTSEHQLAEGPGSTEALNEQGLGWVVTHYHVEITRWPQPNENIIISTEPVGYNRFLEYRDFAISDQAGNNLITAKSEWVLFDLKKRKLVSTDKKMMEELGVPLLKKIPRFLRLRLQDDYPVKRKYRVRYDDLDTNHHMTNGHYFNWLLDTLERDFLKNHVVSSIDIKFNLEVRYGETPFSCLKLVEDGDQIESYHAIGDEDKKDKALCELSWRKI